MIKIIIFVVTYLMIAYVTNFYLCFLGEKKGYKVDVNVNMFCALFWPLVIAIYLFDMPFKFTSKLAKKMNKKPKNIVEEFYKQKKDTWS